MDAQSIDTIDWWALGPPPPQHLSESDVSLDANNERRPQKTSKRQPMAAMACQPCRARKVRCDGGQPKCASCSRREEDCEYIMPKRRGPDKQPGTRIRLWRRKPQGNIDSQTTTQRSKRTQVRDRSTEDEHDELLRAVPESVQRSVNSSPRRRTRAQTQIQIETLNQPQVETQMQAQMETQFLMQLQTQTRMSSEEYDPSTTAAEPSGSGDTYYHPSTYTGTIFSPTFYNAVFQHTNTSGEEPIDPFGFSSQSAPSLQFPDSLNTHESPNSSVDMHSNSSVNYGHLDPSVALNEIPRGPSVAFHRTTWWDSLIQTYCDDPLKSAERIFLDITFLFRNTVYWYSFINLPFLLERLFDPIQRTNLQPSLVLGSLALSVLMRSSEVGLGEKGRQRALMLRDAAQSALEASISAGWIEPSLAQAALILTLFESSAHPGHTSARTVSSIYLLDSLINALGLLMIDIREPTVSLFPAGEIPIASSYSLDSTPQFGALFVPPVDQISTSSAPSSHYIAGGKTDTCGCPEELNDVILIPNNPVEGEDSKVWDKEFADGLLQNSYTGKSEDVIEIRRSLCRSLFNLPLDGHQGPWNRNPYNSDMHFNLRALGAQTSEDDQRGWVNRNVYSKQPYWPDMQSSTDIQKEELRRLCWSALIVTTNITEFTPYLQHVAWDLHITKQENYAIFLPGELTRAGIYPTAIDVYSSKNTIWALHCRAVLLWNITQRLKDRPDWELRKAEFSGRAWLEATALESALARHTCAMGSTPLYPVRETIFQLKFMISHNFTRFIPFPHTLPNDRNSLEEWLLHRGQIAAHCRKMAYFVTRFGAGLAALSLAKRPLSVWWALYQIKAGNLAWQSDPTLTYALEHSLDFAAVADFMVAMWRSPAQEAYYAQLKKELYDACALAGVAIPAPVPIPGLPGYIEVSAVVPSLPSAIDIPILPLD